MPRILPLLIAATVLTGASASAWAADIAPGAEPGVSASSSDAGPTDGPTPGVAERGAPTPATAIRVGASAAYQFHPGGRIDLAILGARGLRPTWIATAGVGVFGRPNEHVDLWWSGLGGVRLHTRSGWFGELAAGLGYDARWQIETLTVDLGSGGVTPRRTLHHRVVPHVAVRTGIDRGARVTWFVDVSVGRALTATAPDEAWFATTAGVQIALSNRAAEAP